MTSGSGTLTLLRLPPRFPEVALQWFQALLTDCEAPRHGVDLFGRDALLLGRCVHGPNGAVAIQVIINAVLRSTTFCTHL